MYYLLLYLLLLYGQHFKRVPDPDTYQQQAQPCGKVNGVNYDCARPAPRSY
jgi:hypothetical protein